MHVNDHLLDICFHKSIQRRRRPENTIAILEPFLRSRDLTLQVFDTRDRELVQNHDVYT